MGGWLGVRYTVQTMAVAQKRERFTSEELAMVLSNYDLGIVEGVSEFARGHHGAAKVVIRSSRGKFLLKRRPKGKDDPDRVAFAHALQIHLAERNFPLPHLIGTREGNNSMLRIDESIYEMFEYVEGSPYDNGLVATYEAGKMLGLYHRLVHDYDPGWEPPRGLFHNSAAVIQMLRDLGPILAGTPAASGREAELQETLKSLRDAYREAASRANEAGVPQWQPQIVHCDWHPGNMLFDRGHVVAVLDFDAARIQPRIIDLANGTLQFSMIAGGRDLTDWEDRLDEPRAMRFLRGYDEMNVISRAEFDALPWLMQEALIAQAAGPIKRTTTFAGLEGFPFLKIVLRKVNWLAKNRAWTRLDAAE